MNLIYQIGIRIFHLIVIIASPFSRKAGKWISGRRNTRSVVRNWQPSPGTRTLWMHVSSLGEFEQGRPLMERWKEQFPQDHIVLSFYSPSGYDIRKNYPLADVVFYLPVDTRGRMERLTAQIRPDLFVLVRYDFWPNLLSVLQKRGTPVYLISARFRKEDYFFRWWGGFFLRQLTRFEGIFVQDELSATLLQSSGCKQVVIAGDTRVDAVMGRAGHQPSGAGTQPADYSVILAGSTWPPEEELLARWWQAEATRTIRRNWRLVIAPHDISEEHLQQIEKRFDGRIVRHSTTVGDWNAPFSRDEIILIDSIGLLTGLYRHASLAIIGGGFGKGIHNTLEPAAFGIPIVFGPRWTKFREAHDLITLGGAFPVSDFRTFSSTLDKLCQDSVFRAESGTLAISYMKSQMGSTDLIIRYLLGKW